MARRSRQEKKHGAKAKQGEANLASEAQAIAANVSKPSFDKAQRKEVQKAIEAGIAQYKRQFNAKQRSYDKQAKKAMKALDQAQQQPVEDEAEVEFRSTAGLAWGLLALSWLFFLGVYLLDGSR